MFGPSLDLHHLRDLALERDRRGRDTRRRDEPRGRQLQPGVLELALAARQRPPSVRFIGSRRSQVAMFHTNSPVSCANVVESFGPLLENITVGGVSQTALK